MLIFLVSSYIQYAISIWSLLELTSCLQIVFKWTLMMFTNALPRSLQISQPLLALIWDNNKLKVNIWRGKEMGSSSRRPLRIFYLFHIFLVWWFAIKTRTTQPLIVGTLKVTQPLQSNMNQALWSHTHTMSARISKGYLQKYLQENSS